MLENTTYFPVSIEYKYKPEKERYHIDRIDGNEGHGGGGEIHELNLEEMIILATLPQCLLSPFTACLLTGVRCWQFPDYLTLAAAEGGSFLPRDSLLNSALRVDCSSEPPSHAYVCTDALTTTNRQNRRIKGKNIK